VQDGALAALLALRGGPTPPCGKRLAIIPVLRVAHPRVTQSFPRGTRAMPKGAALAIATALTAGGALLFYADAPVAALLLFLGAAFFDYLFVRALLDERRRARG
jgi:hypothetical protein